MVEHRPGVGGGGTGLVTIVVAMRRTPESARHRVIVTAFRNQTGDTSLAQLGAVAADWVSRGITETRAVEVSDPLLSTAAKDSFDPRAVGRTANADLVVEGSYARQRDSITMVARLVDAQSGKVLRTTAPVVAPVSEPLLLVNGIRERVAGALAAEVDPVIARMLREGSQPPTYEAYLAWVDGVERYSHRDFRGSLAPLLRASALDTAFVSPLIWAMAAYGNLGEDARADSILKIVLPLRSRLAPIDRGLVGVWEGSLHGDRMAEYQAAREMLVAAPGSELSLYLAGLSALYINRPREAAEILARIHADNSPVLWDVFGTQLPFALHLIGQHDRELAEAERRLRRQPTSVLAMRERARALVALNRTNDAIAQAGYMLERGRDASISSGGAAFDVASELAVHGHADEARQVYTRILEWIQSNAEYQRRSPALWPATLCRLGKYDQADSLIRIRLDSTPDDVTFLRWHGTVAASRGDRMEALRTATRLGALTTPYLRGTNTLARAEILAMLGDKSEATRLLRSAISEGWSGYQIHSYPDFIGLRGYAPFDALIAPAG